MAFTEHGRVAAQKLADDHRELARRLFADMPEEAFERFDGGLSQVVARLRTVLAPPDG